jgi:fatty acid desaturase
VTTTSEPPGEEFRLEGAGLSAEEVRKLSRLDPWRSTLSVAVNWAVVALLSGLALHGRQPLIVAAAVVGLALGQHGLAVLAHEAAHYRLYRSRRVNDFVGKLCGAPLGVSMLTYRVIHRIHHNHLYQDIDPDLALIAGYPRGRLYLLGKLLKDLTGITTLKNYRYFKGRMVKPISTGKPLGTASGPGSEPQTRLAPLGSPYGDTSSALRRAARRDRRLVLALHVAALALASTLGWWRWYLMLWLFPLVTVLQMILRLRAVCEHGAVGDLSTPLRAARTTLAPFWLRALLFPHHVNYHIEHHLYPSVPHYRLAECHRRLSARGALDGAEVIPTLRLTLRKIFAERLV